MADDHAGHNVVVDHAGDTWRTRCECGGFESDWFQSPNDAMREGVLHVNPSAFFSPRTVEYGTGPRPAARRLRPMTALDFHSQVVVTVAVQQKAAEEAAFDDEESPVVRYLGRILLGMCTADLARLERHAPILIGKQFRCGYDDLVWPCVDFGEIQESHDVKPEPRR